MNKKTRITETFFKLNSLILILCLLVSFGGCKKRFPNRKRLDYGLVLNINIFHIMMKCASEGFYLKKMAFFIQLLFLLEMMRLYI